MVGTGLSAVIGLQANYNENRCNVLLYGINVQYY